MNKLAFHRCPITYQAIKSEEKYSISGLKLLSPKLTHLADLPYTAKEQRLKASQFADKLSIQGVQPKLSAKINVRKQQVELVAQKGQFILKPQSDVYLALPENEDVTMRLAATCAIEVPLHGLLYSCDQSLTYFIKRFDRIQKKQRVAVEDFAQLSGHNRLTKYQFSMERLIPIIERYCTFPLLAKQQLLLRTLFNYLVGNEDMHLKNFSLISRHNKVELAPAYDFVNSSIALEHPKEELALPLHGKKKQLHYKDFIDYYAKQRLALTTVMIDDVLQILSTAYKQWPGMIKHSFLPPIKQEQYYDVIVKRSKKLRL